MFGISSFSGPFFLLGNWNILFGWTPNLDDFVFLVKIPANTVEGPRRKFYVYKQKSISFHSSYFLMYWECVFLLLLQPRVKSVCPANIYSD